MSEPQFGSTRPNAITIVAYFVYSETDDLPTEDSVWRGDQEDAIVKDIKGEESLAGSFGAGWRSTAVNPRQLSRDEEENAE